MRSLLATAFLAAAFITLCLAADKSSVEWTLLEVNTQIKNDASVHVRETHHVTLFGDVSTITHRFGLDTDQSIALAGVWRPDESGARRPLTPGDPNEAGHYRLTADTLEWNVDNTVGSEGEVTRIFEVEYDLANAVSPAWTISAGPLPFNGSDSMTAPQDRWNDLIVRWREALPVLRKAYRFDHDVLFPSQWRADDDLQQLDYHMQYDDAWRLLTPDEGWNKATPEIDYRVRATFEYLHEGRPGAANLRASAVRMGSITALPLAGLLLFIIFIAGSPTSRRRPAIDRAWISEHLLAAPAEAVAGEFGGSEVTPTLETVLNQMTAAHKLRVRILQPETDDDFAQVEMRLLASRDSLALLERAVVDALFGDGNVTTTELVQQRYRDTGFDGDDLVAAAQARSGAANSRTWRWHPVGSTVALAAGLVGLALMIGDLPTTKQPFALIVSVVVTSIVAGLASARRPRLDRSMAADLLLMLPLIILTMAVAAVHLAMNKVVSPVAAAGMSLFALGRYQSILNGARPVVRRDRKRRMLDLAQARRFAQRELRKPHPTLEDAWIPHLEALGLSGEIEKWRHRFSGATGAEISPMFVKSAGAFTGRAPEIAGLPPGWSEGFWVSDESEDEEDNAEDSAGGSV